MVPVFWSELARRPEAVVLTIAMAIVYPLLGYRRFLEIQQLPEPLDTGTKVRAYRNIVLSQWTLVLATVIVLHRAGGSLADLGFAVRSWVLTIGVSLALLAGFALLSRLTLRQLAEVKPGELPEHVRRAGRVLPRTGRERAGFAAVAFTAGVCEEILYRGWLPWALAGWFGSALPGFALAAIVFGLGHAYQGRTGVLLTMLLATFLGAVAYFTRTIVPGQLLHVAIDLVNGMAVGAVLARHAAEPPPPPPPPPDEPHDGPPGGVDASSIPTP